MHVGMNHEFPLVVWLFRLHTETCYAHRHMLISDNFFNENSHSVKI